MTDARNRILTTLGAIVASGAVLAACSDEPGTPNRTGEQPTETSQRGGNLPHSGAPKVANPITDTSAWESDPCGVISDQQFATIGIKIREAVPDPEAPVGPTCDWLTDSGASSFSGAFATINKEGLSTVYASNQAGKFGKFEVLEMIDGHPAVIAMERDETNEGVCSLAVGVRDDLDYGIVTTFDSDTPEAKDPCGTAQEIAALAVQTMKGGA